MCLQWIALNWTNDATSGFGVYVVYPDVLNTRHQESSKRLSVYGIYTAKPSSKHCHCHQSRCGNVNGFDIAGQGALTSRSTTILTHMTTHISPPSIRILLNPHIRRHIDTFCTHLTMMANIAQHFYDPNSHSLELWLRSFFGCVFFLCLHNQPLLSGCPVWLFFRSCCFMIRAVNDTQNAVVVSSGGGCDDPFEWVLWFSVLSIYVWVSWVNEIFKTKREEKAKQ